MLRVEKVYVAHYTPLAERKKFLMEQLIANNLVGEWFEGEPTEAQILELYDDASKSWMTKMPLASESPWTSPRPLRPAEISLAYKHFKIYEHMVKNQIGTALVLEDDVVLAENFVNKFNFNIFNTPADYDFIYIGSGCGLRINPRRIVEGQNAYLKEHPASKCTDSYVVTLASAQKVYDSMQPFTFPIDFELNYQMAKHDMKVYWWEPPVVRQGSQCGIFESQIQ